MVQAGSNGLWIEKHRPNGLKGLDFHKAINQRLMSLAHAEDFPHLILAGPRGAGKATRLRALLSEIFDSSVAKMKIDERVFVTPSGRKIEVTVFASPHHVELNPSEVGIYDRVVVQEVIKDLAQTQLLDRSKHSFKVVVVHEADRLSRDAQHSLRRTMEKYTGSMRLVLCCSALSRVLGPIRSRCLVVRVPAPSSSDMISVLERIAHKEGARLSQDLIKKISAESEGNFRRALLALETAAMSSQENIMVDWVKIVNDTVQLALKEQTPACLLLIRAKLYELLTHAIPPSIIFQAVVKAFCSVRQVESELLVQVFTAAAFYEQRCCKGNKAIFHLEAFFAKVMSHLSVAKHV